MPDLPSVFLLPLTEVKARISRTAGGSSVQRWEVRELGLKELKALKIWAHAAASCTCSGAAQQASPLPWDCGLPESQFKPV